MGAEAALLTRTRRRPSRRRAASALSLNGMVERWGAAKVAELGRSIRNRVTWVNLLAAILLAAVAAYHVRTGIEIDRLGDELSHARVVHQQLVHELDLLRAAYAEATSPAALERAAFERLGMKPPAPGQIVVLR